MHSSPPLLVMDYVGPALGAVIFVLVMSLVKEPTRRTCNAILVAGASGVYPSGGFGPWELLYPAIAIPVMYLGPTSSFGGMIFDALIAVRFLASAPSMLTLGSRKRTGQSATVAGV